MVTVDCSTTESDGVTLVTVRLAGGPVPQRVTLANRLSGPVWPPRREGVPAAGWGEDGYAGVVPADGRLVLGYASPAEPRDPPVELVESEPVADDSAVEDAGDRTDGDPSETALRRLGDPSPPRDAVPLPGPGPDRAASAPAESGSTDADDGTDVGPTAESRDGERLPEPVRAWFAAVETDVATGERLADATSLPAATEALDDVGGLDEAEAHVERLAADARTLAAVADRAAELAERAEAVDAPIDSFRALA